MTMRTTTTNSSDRSPLLRGNSTLEDSNDARKILATGPTGVRGEGPTTLGERQMVEMADIRGILFPWDPLYQAWWSLTALGAIVTAFFCPFQIAFENLPGTTDYLSSQSIEWVVNCIFCMDIVINFNLAFYKHERIVFERKDIAVEYVQHGMFRIDLIGVFPFESVVLALTGELGQNSTQALLLSLLRCLRFVRLHRMKRLSDLLQYNARVSLLWFTMIRNFAAVILLTHCEACAMYFSARLHAFDEGTWLGPHMADEMSTFQCYVTALYLSIVTFCTVGYGDFSPKDSTEQIVGSVSMLLNIVVAAWIIGSITLLIVKGDEKTGEYRDQLETLHQYGEMHHFDATILDKLKRQLRLEFNNREIADEQVLKNFPSSVRRKILRRLYLQPLLQTRLMKGVRQAFVDAFLTSCKVEIFSPGEEIVERGSVLSDLFLLVGGIAEITTPAFAVDTSKAKADDDNDDFNYKTTAKVLDENGFDAEAHLHSRKLTAGDFIGEIGFFTESPQVESVLCLTVCKTLTMSRTAYQLLAQEHPASVGKILQNLLVKVKELSLQLQLPKDLSILRAGSQYDPEAGYGTLSMRSVTISMSEDISGSELAEELERKQESLTAVEDLVKMYLSKQLDDQTTRLLFAASRGDTHTINLMCDQGFDPNSADYDNRTALMVASMKGNTDVVRLLLEYKANPNLIDMHGSSALLEAVKNGHEATMNLLKDEFGAELCMPEKLAASVLCQAVFDGDILLLKRLLKAGIDPNAADYDKRTAAHIAAAEGNVAAIRVLSEHGADLNLEDRWKNKVKDEAQRCNARPFLEFLKGRESNRNIC